MERKELLVQFKQDFNRKTMWLIQSLSKPEQDRRYREIPLTLKIKSLTKSCKNRMITGEGSLNVAGTAVTCRCQLRIQMREGGGREGARREGSRMLQEKLNSREIT